MTALTTTETDQAYFVTAYFSRPACNILLQISDPLVEILLYWVAEAVAFLGRV